ncbi:MAG: response regulator transcription factor [Bacteroidetes bacterium]|uniref:Response regulator transcription factor n=1 Tax=Candidatus Merdivivens pullistercoris TaxID=2840873 RepID=A0A9D9I4Q6_9BACT|nr:response regulator transcription factor [Candidatus Merdivivens pullistercoris]
MKILVIEDEPSLRTMMCDMLEKEKYIVESAGDFHRAEEKINDYEYDVILLDIMLPGGSGMELLKILKESKKQAHVLIISAKDSLEDKLEGLDLGADDYITKPFHLAELSARIRSVTRRGLKQGSDTINYGNVSLNTLTRKCTVGEAEVQLVRKEYDILLHFMTRPDHVSNKLTLAEAVWGDNIDQADNFDFIYAQIKNLRKKLQAAGADIEIKAVYGFGYKLTRI